MKIVTKSDGLSGLCDGLSGEFYIKNAILDRDLAKVTA